jgi:hypothetical protein
MVMSSSDRKLKDSLLSDRKSRYESSAYNTKINGDLLYLVYVDFLVTNEQDRCSLTALAISATRETL